MALTTSIVTPNPDDATNGVVAGVSIKFHRGAAVTLVIVDNPGDPNGPLEVPLATLLPVAGDRTTLRDLLLKIAQNFKTARGYV